MKYNHKTHVARLKMPHQIVITERTFLLKKHTIEYTNDIGIPIIKATLLGNVLKKIEITIAI